MRHRRGRRPAADFADRHDVDAEFLVADAESDELPAAVQSDFVRRFVIVSLSGRGERRFELQGLAARRRDDGVDVQDESDAAITENGGGGDAGNMGVVGFEALDDDLALALDGIDHQGALAAAFGFHQESDAFDRVGLCRRGS